MIEQYQFYRRSLMDFYSKIQKRVSREMIDQAAELLNIIENKQFVFDNKNEADFLFDFIYYEKLFNGNSAIDLFLQDQPKLNKIEKELIQSMKNATNSLYKIDSINVHQHQIKLIDLIHMGRSIIITDINLSRTCHPSMILFTRIIELNNLNFTSGLLMIFDGSRKDLLKGNKPNLLNNAATNRYISLFHENRKNDIPLSFSKV